MKQEFTTTYGSVVIERKVLFIRNVDVPFSRTAFAQIAWEFIFIVVFALQFYRSDGPIYYVRMALWGMVLISRFPNLLDLLVRRSYANRIPIRNIVSVTREEDKSGLQVIVRLHLVNGRSRKIFFRKLENQAESFMEQLSPLISAPKFA